MRKFGPSIEIAPKTQRPLPDKEIIWGSQDGGSNCFPAGIDVIQERKFSDNPAPLIAFGYAISNSLDRVWIVDEYLLMPEQRKGESSRDVSKKILGRTEKILEWLHTNLAASDIRFLTKHHTEVQASGVLKRFQDRAQEINSSGRRQMKCTIEVRTHITNNFDYIHDRFAIIDDELWHFGGTTGGFHASVTAASRGWSATEHGAIKFFEMAWNAGAKV